MIAQIHRENEDGDTADVLAVIHVDPARERLWPKPIAVRTCSALPWSLIGWTLLMLAMGVALGRLVF